MNLNIELVGTSPLLMHSNRLANPDCEISRQIAAITGKRKKTEQDRQVIAKLEFHGGLYLMQNGKNGKYIPSIPTANVKKCIIQAAKITKKGTAVSRALSFSHIESPLIHDGPNDAEKLWESGNYHDTRPAKVGSSTVLRTRPKFFPWSWEGHAVFIKDAGLELDELIRIIELAGVVERLGDNRINGFGGFEATILEE